MEFLFEFVLDLVFEGMGEASKCPRVPKPARYALIAVLALLYAAVVGIVALAGLLFIKDGRGAAGTVMLIIAALLLIFGARTFIKTYLKRKSG